MMSVLLQSYNKYFISIQAFAFEAQQTKSLTKHHSTKISKLHFSTLFYFVWTNKRTEASAARETTISIIFSSKPFISLLSSSSSDSSNPLHNLFSSTPISLLKFIHITQSSNPKMDEDRTFSSITLKSIKFTSFQFEFIFIDGNMLY